MNREELVGLCDRQVKLVRAEYSFSQEKMALMLGLSKKTLVEIEKGRSSLGWTGSVAFCTIFAGSGVVQGALGGNPAELILDLAFQGSEPRYPQTLGGRIWWQTVMENGVCRIQQNIISQHYRLLTMDGRRIASSFDLEDLTGLFHDAAAEEKREEKE